MSSLACSTPGAYGEPTKEQGPQRKRDRTDECSAATRAKTREESGNDEQANRIEDEEGTNKPRNDCDNETQRSLLGLGRRPASLMRQIRRPSACLDVDIVIRRDRPITAGLHEHLLQTGPNRPVGARLHAR